MSQFEGKPIFRKHEVDQHSFDRAAFWAKLFAAELSYSSQMRQLMPIGQPLPFIPDEFKSAAVTFEELANRPVPSVILEGIRQRNLARQKWLEWLFNCDPVQPVTVTSADAVSPEADEASIVRGVL